MFLYEEKEFMLLLEEGETKLRYVQKIGYELDKCSSGMHRHSQLVQYIHEVRNEITEGHRKAIPWANEVVRLYHRSIRTVRACQRLIHRLGQILTSPRNTGPSRPFRSRSALAHHLDAPARNTLLYSAHLWVLEAAKQSLVSNTARKKEQLRNIVQ